MGDEPFCAAVVYFLLHTEPFVPDGQDDKIKILNSTRPIRTIVAPDRWHVRCFGRLIERVAEQPRRFSNQ
jgi:hypothetical protein